MSSVSLKDLVDFAQPAVEIIVDPIDSQPPVANSRRSYRLRTGLKAAAQKTTRSLKLKTLQHAAKQTAHRAKVKSAIKKSVTKKLANRTKLQRPPKNKPEELVEGVKIQVRPRRVVRRPSRANLINAEAFLGSTIFGPIPANHQREFFHDHQNIWVWRETWIDTTRRHRQLTIRYEVRPSGVYKKLSIGKYTKLEGSELENFRRATHVYLYTIKQKLYHHV